MKYGRPSTLIDWACLTLTKDVARCSRPYLCGARHVQLFQKPSSTRRESAKHGSSTVNFFHRFFSEPRLLFARLVWWGLEAEKSCLFVSLYSVDEAAVRYARAFLGALS